MGQGAVKDGLFSIVVCLPLSEAEPTRAGTPIGWMNVGSKVAAGSQHRKADLGIVVRSDQQGKGYGTEATEWAVAVAFQRANLHRLELECFADNIGARKVYEKCGFVLEGIQRQSLWNGGAWQDNCFYGLLADDWRAAQRAR